MINAIIIALGMNLIVLFSLPLSVLASDYQYQGLGIPGDAYDINNSGSIVGEYYCGSGNIGLLYNGGGFTPIVYPGAYPRQALSSDDSG